jgi:hypothetical protein
LTESAQRWYSQTRFLFRVALAIFTVTVAIGIFNGFHFIQLSRAVLLTHVHAGTLGWITLVAFGAAYWLYGGADVSLDGHARGVARGMAIAVPVYVLAFLTGVLLLRAIFGVPVLLLIVGVVVLLVRGIRSAGVSVPRLGMLLAFIVLIIGSTLGVLIQIQLATSHTLLPDGAIGGHASAQVGGYLVLFALSSIEWRLKGGDGTDMLGRVQVTLLFIGGILLAIGVLFNVQPLEGIFIPLDIAAFVIFLIRVGPRVVGAPWLEATASRHYAIAVPWALVNFGITVYAVIQLISKGPAGFNFNLFTAADHAIFLGVMTNLAFGLMHDFAADRPQVWPHTENVVFWVMNIALAGFVVSLITGTQAAEKFFVPFQGIAILVGIIAFSMRLAADGPPAPAEAAAAAAA